MKLPRISSIKRRTVELMHRTLYSASHVGLAPGHRSYKRFLIVTNIRTGSSMLVSYLNSHPQVVPFFEPFHSDCSAIPFNVAGFKALETMPRALQLRESDPPQFVEDFIFRRFPRHVAAVGFKLLYTQGCAPGQRWWEQQEYSDWWTHCGAPKPRGDQDHDLWKSLADMPDLHVIHLQRRNTLRQILSSEVAKTTRCWGATASGGFGTDEGMHIALDVRRLARDLKASERFVQETDERFQNHPRLGIAYEDLVYDTPAALQRVQQFLEISPIALQSNSIKQSRQPLQTLMTNYREVEKFLAGTRFQWMLEDEPEYINCPFDDDSCSPSLSPELATAAH
jgi:LPS sulfotransferase NodH